MRKILSLLILALMFTSCASLTPGNYTMVENGDHPKILPITSWEDELYSYANYKMINFTFSNLSVDEWVRIKNIEIKKVDGSPNAKIIIGNDLYTWSEAMNNKISVDQQNKDVLLGVATIGLVAASAYSGSKGNVTQSQAAYALATGIVTVDSINKYFKQIDAMERANFVPQSHLYSPFSIPPALVTKKWILFQIPKDERFEKVHFEVEYLDGKKVTYYTTHL